MTIKGTGGLGSWGTSWDHPNYNIVENGQILRRIEETCCHSNSSERPSANADVKNSKGVNKNNNKKKKNKNKNKKKYKNNKDNNNNNNDNNINNNYKDKNNNTSNSNNNIKNDYYYSTLLKLFPTRVSWYSFSLEFE